MDGGGVGATNDPGATAFAFILQLLGLPANPSEILHHSGRPAMGEDDILRAAKRFPLKCRAIQTTVSRLEATPLPALAALKDGAWMVLGKAAEGKILVQDPRKPNPEMLTPEIVA